MKHIKNLHLGLIGIAFIVTIGLLFGGQALANKFQVSNPLKQDIHRIKEIKSYTVKEDKDGMIVTLKLKKVTDLQQVLDYVQQKVELYYNLPVKSFKIVDHRDHQLEQIRYQLSFYLQEAAVSGHYIQLKQALDSYHPVNAKAYFSRNNIYLQLEQGKDYLYEIIPIPAKTLVYNNSGGGST